MRGTSGDALRELSRARTVVLTTHINPDGDALGSMIALYLFLKNGTRVSMWLDDTLPGMYSFLPEIDKIVRPPASFLRQEICLSYLMPEMPDVQGSSYANFRGRSLKYRSSSFKFRLRGCVSY